ncbi:MAG: proline/glycine betaine ABC transporter permease [Gammaproteobacteria bacterium]
MFPEQFRIPLGQWINHAIDWLVETHGQAFEAAGNALLKVLVVLEQGLRGAPWWLVIAIIGMLAFHATRRALVALALMAAMFAIGMLGLWDLAMQTLSLMLAAIVLGIVVGLPVGIAMAQSERMRAVILPLLDVMQTMPSFVYLIPALMLFGLGKVPALLATVIYAAPPLIRLTDLGIRLVDREIVEASDAFGASTRQKLLGVQLPLALPNIMQGINQMTMMALAMVVIASMIGARGLGEEVLLGIQRLDFGRGAEAGLSIVALAIIFDRITQAYGRAQDQTRRAAG